MGDDGSDVQAALVHSGHLAPPDRRVTKQSPGEEGITPEWDAIGTPCSAQSGPGAEGIAIGWVVFLIRADLLHAPVQDHLPALPAPHGIKAFLEVINPEAMGYDGHDVQAAL
jgi:hypothetical protein